MLTVPLFLGIARIPELEEEGVEVSSAQGWLWALYLFVLVVPISLTSMWLSSLSMNFLTMFTVGIVYGVALVAIASTIIVVIYILWRKIEGEPLKWW